MNQERLMKVLLSPHISEKTTRLADNNNQITFKVLPNATKQEIKSAVEFLFKVNVTGVQVMNVKGKKRRFAQTIGRRKDWKKAYVTLREGDDIDFAGAESA
ncbi:MAG: 50S ribosomal protein L23 [Gammaproteobacteria bacterium]|nr:50S ribosomal protein L23 [Gammaproteobacteria bacterium]MCK5091193.1 50S ribosomal protein L23 [Gammaproteobacteria bacterium]